MSLKELSEALDINKSTAYRIQMCIRDRISSGDGHRAARSILTIDKNPKELAVKINTEKFFNMKKDIIVGAIGKGSIMVAPNMGTILCFIATNVKIHQNLLDGLLHEGVDQSFNSISIDGCQSTNDMVFIQNNGESGIEITKDNRELYDVFRHTLFFVLEEMAKKVILAVSYTHLDVYKRQVVYQR